MVWHSWTNSLAKSWDKKMTDKDTKEQEPKDLEIQLPLSNMSLHLRRGAPHPCVARVKFGPTLGLFPLEESAQIEGCWNGRFGKRCFCPLPKQKQGALLLTPQKSTKMRSGIASFVSSLLLKSAKYHKGYKRAQVQWPQRCGFVVWGLRDENSWFCQTLLFGASLGDLGGSLGDDVKCFLLCRHAPLNISECCQLGIFTWFGTPLRPL